MNLFPIIGQAKFIERLGELARSGHVGHAHLFTGPVGVGKDALAFHFAALLNCTNSGEKPCGVCPACRQFRRLEHPALHLVVALPNKSRQSSDPDPYKGFSESDMELVRETIAAKAKNPYRPLQLPGANNIRISSIRKLRQDIYLRMNPGMTKIVIILEAHRMNGESFNALLKILEEPPANTVFILTTAFPDRIPETIISRCQYYRIPPVLPEDLTAHLVRRFETPPDEAAVIASLAQGDVQSAEYYASDHQRRWLDILRRMVRTLLSRRTSELQLLVKHLSDKKRLPVEELQQILSVLILFLRDTAVTPGLRQAIWREELEALLAWAPTFEARTAVALVDQCKDALARKVYFPLALTHLFLELQSLVQGTQKEYQV